MAVMHSEEDWVLELCDAVNLYSLRMSLTM